MLQNLGPVSTHDNPNFCKLRLKTPIVKNKNLLFLLGNCNLHQSKAQINSKSHRTAGMLTSLSSVFNIFSGLDGVFFSLSTAKMDWGSLGRHWEKDGHSNYHTNYITLVPELYFRNDILWQNYWTASIIRH